MWKCRYERSRTNIITAMWYFMFLLTGLWLWRTGFMHMGVHMGYVVYRLALGKFLFPSCLIFQSKYHFTPQYLHKFFGGLDSEPVSGLISPVPFSSIEIVVIRYSLMPFICCSQTHSLFCKNYVNISLILSPGLSKWTSVSLLCVHWIIQQWGWSEETSVHTYWGESIFLWRVQ
jgi:hypothetical protein